MQKTLVQNLKEKTSMRGAERGRGHIVYNFYFSQILTGIVEKQHALIPFNFF